MKILLLGRQGQLGSRFEQFLKGRSCELLTVGRQECDLSLYKKVLDLLQSFQPQMIINIAAYNAVDLAETQPSIAWTINAQLPEWLADWCHKHDGWLVHYSTDYFFDGLKKSPYVENNSTQPLNEYGRSKLAGEQAVTQIKNHLVFRVSWLFGGEKQNFLCKIDEWLKQGKNLEMACDEVSIPTSVDTVILGSWLALQKQLSGLYHLTNYGYASRWEWARYYLKLKGLDAFIYPSYQKDFQLPAHRPRFSVLNNHKLARELNISFPHWEEEMLRLFQHSQNNFWKQYGIE